jgi:hypothetical protein
VNIPIGFASDSVQVFPALLAKIFIGAHFLVHDSHTATMLPNFAGIALNEHTPNIIGQHIGRISRWVDRFWLDDAATESFATRGGQAWIILLPTQTPCDFLLFLLFYIIFILLAGRILVTVVGALTLARLWEVGPRAIFAIVDGLGSMARGALRRVIFMV